MHPIPGRSVPHQAHIGSRSRCSRRGCGQLPVRSWLPAGKRAPAVAPRAGRPAQWRARRRNGGLARPAPRSGCGVRYRGGQARVLTVPRPSDEPAWPIAPSSPAPAPPRGCAAPGPEPPTARGSPCRYRCRAGANSRRACVWRRRPSGARQLPPRSARAQRGLEPDHPLCKPSRRLPARPDHHRQVSDRRRLVGDGFCCRGTAAAPTLLDVLDDGQSSLTAGRGSLGEPGSAPKPLLPRPPPQFLAGARESCFGCGRFDRRGLLNSPLIGARARAAAARGPETRRTVEPARGHSCGQASSGSAGRCRPAAGRVSGSTEGRGVSGPAARCVGGPHPGAQTSSPLRQPSSRDRGLSGTGG
jgi:hypothetical protein